MQDYVEDVKESGEKFAVAMLDIDHFKKVNDTYGHDAGDKVIVTLADILRSSTNPQDVVARFGGEEFCLVLKNINRYSALEILERIRQSIESYSVEIEKEKFINFTVSIGAVINNEEDSLQECINEADMCLYKAKNSGRNQVVFEG